VGSSSTPKGNHDQKKIQKKEMASGFNVSEEGLLSDRMVREIVPPWSFLLDTMHLYWSNGVVSWEVNALYNLWKDSGHGDLNRFFSLEWKTVGTQSNTKSWRNSLCHESMFAGVAYKGSASNLQFFFPLFEHFLDGCWQNNDTFAVALQSVQALRRITIELRSLAREDVQPLSEFQELQRTHHDLTKKAFGYDHIKQNITRGFTL
jgi:hypothetical protein